MASTTNAQARSDSTIPRPTHSDLVTYPALPHALPFRTIFGEYFVRRPRDLAKVTARILTPDAPAPVGNSECHDFNRDQWAHLQQAIDNSEVAYRDLAAKKETLAALPVTLPAAAEKNQRQINQLVRDIELLEKQILATPDSKEELEAEKAKKNDELSEQRQQKRENRIQARIAHGYEDVLAAEKACKKADEPLLQVLHGMSASAVCFSGGGIRSASFCLGVLQGLARFSVNRAPKPGSKSVLAGLDYLSTVSGGGYIGSWLMAWASHSKYERIIELLAHPADTAADPEPQPIRHLREYTSYLAPRYGFSLDTMTLLAIVLRNLVLNWMILVPALIFLFCVPELFYHASALTPLCLRVPRWIPTGYAFDGAVVLAALFVARGTLFAAQSTFKPFYASETKNPRKLGRTSREVARLVLPIFVGMSILAEAWAWANRPGNPAPVTASSPLTMIAAHFAVFAILPPMVMAFARVWWLRPHLDVKNPSPLRRNTPDEDGESHAQQKTAADDESSFVGCLLRWSAIVDWGKLIWALVAPFMTGVLIALALAACAKYIDTPYMFGKPGLYQVTRKFVWLCLPIIWTVMLMASSVLSGLVSAIEAEEEREWWSRATGLIIMFQIGLISLIGIAFYGGETLRAFVAVVLAALGLASGYVGSLSGLSAATTSGLKKVTADQLTTAQKWLSKHDLFAPLACAIAIVCLSLAIASLTSGIRGHLYASLQGGPKVAQSSVSNALTSGTVTPATANTEESGISWAVRSGLMTLHIDTRFLDAAPLHQPSPTEAGRVDQLKKSFIANILVLLTALLIATLANLFINVNTFSLHGMYRMRLTRAYLGASNFARHPDNFTNFDSHDNIYETDIARHNTPLHVINTSLNVVATSNLAWQQRKAESFTFSPISAGSWRLGYLPTAMYGGSRGVTLGTAMAISGAAFSPNMGYNSSPLVTLLMTFFNARLGWWLPNPIWPVLKAESANGDTPLTSPVTLGSILKQSGEANFLRRSSPLCALFILIYEALGRTDDKYKWIELTDGGHFENLGLYEMVLRRCRYIVVVDADADSNFEFEDLGNAIRKVEIDLGVPIRFPGYPDGLPMKHRMDRSNHYCALGDILYTRVDKAPDSSGKDKDGDKDKQEDIVDGKLLYIKPCLNGSEPLGVRAYANAHPKFPHEATINQFFNEPQFESYRNLGSWEFASIVGEFLQGQKPTGNDIQTLFDGINKTA